MFNYNIRSKHVKSELDDSKLLSGVSVVYKPYALRMARILKLSSILQY
jgi:hypothetical protein